MRPIRRSSSALWVALAISAASFPKVAHAAATGTIEGIVTDEETNKPIAGATISVVSPQLQGEQTEFSDASGFYRITELPPGEYVVHFYYSNLTFERSGIVLNADKTLRVNGALPLTKAKTETYKIVEKAPTVDVGNTQVETTITDDIVRNTPIAGINGRRNYESLLTIAPGSAVEPRGLGVSFNGATAPESNFLIDGVNSTSPKFGLIGTQLSVEFLKETEIITGGYNAEYGRSTGGVVNLVTKSGSNQFHGGVWFYYTPFQLTPETVGRVGESIASRQKLNNAFDFGFDLSGPIVKDKIWFYLGFAPTFVTTDNDKIYRTRSANNIGNQSSGTYAGDIDPNAKCPSWLPKEMCVTGGYKTTELGSQYTNHYQSTQRNYNYIAKLNFQINENNSLQLQYIGNPGEAKGVADPFNGYPNGGVYFGNFNGGTGELLRNTDSASHDVGLHFISKLFKKRLQIDVLAGYHIETFKSSPQDPNAANTTSVTNSNVAPLTLYENISPCAPQTINGVSFSPCPVQNYESGGANALVDQTAQRWSAAVAGTWFFRLLGSHALKLGLDFEYNSYRDGQRYSGPIGILTINGDNSASGQAFGTLTGYGTPNQAVSILPNGFDFTTSSTTEALYLRDSWNVGFVPGLTLNYGVRFDFQQMNDQSGREIINIKDNVAPRVGFIYDWTRKGRSKLYANYGRYYEAIPLDLADHTQATQYLFTAGSCPTANGQVQPGQCTASPYGGAGPTTISPKLQGQYINEVVAGLQYDVGLDVVLGAAYVHRELGNVIEDISPDAANHYLVANPGADVDSDTVKDLQNQIAKAADPAKKALLSNQLALYKAQSSFEKPRRDYDAMVLTAQKRFSHNFLMLASYTYSRTIGNYPGTYSSTNAQLNPNSSTQYDLRELMLNRDGPLPTDRPHNFKLLGTYHIPMKGDLSGFDVGLNFNAISGRPIDVLGRHPLYGRYETFVLPRGAGGRTPTVTSFDLHLAYGTWTKDKVMRFDVYWDIFNLFNQQEVTDVDDEYTNDTVMPIKNGTAKDLASLKNIGGGAPLLNPNFGHATAYQMPMSMRFGVRASF